MKPFNAVDTSTALLSSSDQSLLSLSTVFSNRVLERDTGYLVFVSPYDSGDSLSIDSHIEQELTVMVGSSSSMSANFVASIKFAATNNISLLVFDEDAPIPYSVRFGNEEYVFNVDSFLTENAEG